MEVSGDPGSWIRVEDLEPTTLSKESENEVEAARARAAWSAPSAAAGSSNDFGSPPATSAVDANAVAAAGPFNDGWRGAQRHRAGRRAIGAPPAAANPSADA
jgi:hypothetical protein